VLLDSNEINIQLAIYFDCARFLSALETVCTALISVAALAGHYESLWRLLVIAETGRFKDVSELVKALGQDKDAQARSQWNQAMEVFKSGRGRVSSAIGLYMASHHRA
jgi:hypothetical protein